MPKPAPVIDGYTGDQRFYIGWTQAWRAKVRPELALQLLKTDPHSPAAIRGRATLLNQKPFYEAFSVKQEDPMYLEEDKRVKALIEAKNVADSTIYQTEQSLKEMEGKVSDEDKAKVEAAMAELRTASEGEDVEAITKATEALNEAFYPLAQKMYEEAAAQQAPDDQEASAQGSDDDDVVDAEYEEVKE